MSKEFVHAGNTRLTVAQTPGYDIDPTCRISSSSSSSSSSFYQQGAKWELPTYG
jgi:hypothetical protein